MEDVSAEQVQKLLDTYDDTFCLLRALRCTGKFAQWYALQKQHAYRRWYEESANLDELPYLRGNKPNPDVAKEFMQAKVPCVNDIVKYLNDCENSKGSRTRFWEIYSE